MTSAAVPPAWTLGDLIARNAWLYPDRPALVFEGRSLTHGGYARRVYRLANALLSGGARRRSRIAVLAQNCPEYIETFGACEVAGLVTVNLNWRLSPAELKTIIADCRPEVLIFEAQYADKVEELKSELGGRRRCLAIGTAPSWAEGYEAALAAAGDSHPAQRSSPDDTAYLIYTSGTTGRPKGVMLGHRGLIASAMSIALDSGARPTDRMLIVMPMFHIGGRIEYLTFNLLGATVYLHRAFDAAAIIDSMERNRITVAHLAPAMVHAILDAPDLAGRRLDALRLVHYASAPMNVPLLRRAIARFGLIFAQLYGMTESVVGTILQPEQHVLDGPEHQVRRLACAGQPFVGTDIRIVREDGSSCAPEEIGEIAIRGPGTMQGYWNATSAEVEVLRDGVMHTGDMGFFDSEGFLFIVDRKKDVVISGGENIYSREVEEALLTHAAVSEAAVIGVPDERWGESVKACVVLKAGARASEAELIEHVRSRIASYKKPRTVDILEALPRLFNGKIDKKALRAPYWAGRARQVS